MANAAHQSPPASQQPKINIRISPIVEADYKRRRIFGALRSNRAVRRNGRSSVHEVAPGTAKMVQDDAERQAMNSALPVGVRRAYSWLGNRIDLFLWENHREEVAAEQAAAARAKVETPSDDSLAAVQEFIDEMKEPLLAPSPALFAVDERVLYFSGPDADGSPARIVGAYGLRAVRDIDGAHRQPDGVRVNYRYGYIVVVDDSERCFVLAGQLTREDLKPGHLVMVARVRA